MTPALALAAAALAASMPPDVVTWRLESGRFVADAGAPGDRCPWARS